MRILLALACALPDESERPAPRDREADTAPAVDTGPDDTDGADDTEDTEDTDGSDDTAASARVPDFSLTDRNGGSPRSGEAVSPRDYLEQVSGWYFLHAT